MKGPSLPLNLQKKRSTDCCAFHAPLLALTKKNTIRNKTTLRIPFITLRDSQGFPSKIHNPFFKSWDFNKTTKRYIRMFPKIGPGLPKSSILNRFSIFFTIHCGIHQILRFHPPRTWDFKQMGLHGSWTG